MTKYGSFSSFSAQDYLQEYYSHIGSENQSLLAFFAGAYKKVPAGAKIVELGGGPTLYQLISASSKAQNIEFYDYSSINLTEIKKWLDGDPEAFDWDDYYNDSPQQWS